MVFFHAADNDVNLHGGLNKSQFMMTQLFTEHLANDCSDYAGIKFEVKFPDNRMTLEQLTVSQQIYFQFLSDLRRNKNCLKSPM